MKRKIILTALVLVCMMVLTGCFCQHEVWNEANCTTPKTCAECGEIEGAPLGHSWLVANCVDPKTCEVCGATDGEAKGHSWIDATYETPKTCEICDTTEGEPLPPPFLGTWVIERPFTTADMKITDIEYSFCAVYHYTFAADGTMTIEIREEDMNALMGSFKSFFVEYIYTLIKSNYGVDRDAIDAALAADGRPSITEQADASFGEIGLEEALADTNGTGSFYMKDGNVHISIAFADVFSKVVSDPEIPNTFTVEGDTLTLNWASTSLEEPLVLTRVAE